MHDGMQYDSIQGQLKVTTSSKLKILPFSVAVSSAIHNGSWKLTTGS